MKTESLVAAALTIAAITYPCSAASTLSGSVGAGYSGTITNGSGSTYSGSGDLLISLDNPGFNFQLSGGGEKISGGGDANAWVANFDAFWRDRAGSIGVSVGHGTLGVAGLSADFTAYGGFGEWYATRKFTLRVKGGGASGDLSGGYGGVGGKYYFSPNIGMDVTFTYVSLAGHSLYSTSVGTDFQVASDIPLTLRFGSDTTYVASTSSTSIFVALRYRFGAGGTLIDSDRRGPTDWNGALSLL